MDKTIFGAVGLSALLLLGFAPTALLAHEGHEHGGQQGEYRGEQEDAGRYEPQDEDDRWADEDDGEDDTYRPSSRRYPRPDDDYSSPRERRSRAR